LGATVDAEGTNFSVFSANATGMQLVFFDHPDDPVAARTVTLSPAWNRTAHYWHIHVPGIKAGQAYGYRVDGPNDPSRGQRFDKQKVLLDPYGKSVFLGLNYDRDAASRPGDNAAACLRSFVRRVRGEQGHLPGVD
jgi:glycogen operon protein